jgi:hypothetical protein
VRHPALVEAVQAVLLGDPVRQPSDGECTAAGGDAPGPEQPSAPLLIWSSDLNIKPANSDAHFTFHQDSTYMGLEPAGRIVTAWIALTPATEQMGCLRCVSGSHTLGQLPHDEGTGGATNQLSRGQMACTQSGDSAAAQWSEQASVLPLQAGEVRLPSRAPSYQPEPRTCVGGDAWSFTSRSGVLLWSPVPIVAHLALSCCCWPTAGIDPLGAHCARIWTQPLNRATRWVGCALHGARRAPHGTTTFVG